MCQVVNANLELEEESIGEIEEESIGESIGEGEGPEENEGDEGDEGEEEDYFKDVETIRAKWQMDGAKTLDEAIEKLHDFIEFLRQCKRDGYELIEPINDDYGFMKQIKV